MKNTELLFILDKSGSMYGLEQDTIGGFNALLKENQQLKTPCHITTILFDHQINILHDRLDIQTIKPLTEKDYLIGGSTALFDAIGYGISKINNVLKQIDANVLVVIITDGNENSSREYTGPQIKSMINQLKDKNWEFIFLGANIDVGEFAQQVGIDKSRAKSFHSDKKGTQLNYKVMNETIKNYRQNQRIDDKQLDEIDKDFQTRKKWN